MKTGWVICANDTDKSERGYTIVFGERASAKHKSLKIKKKFKERFKLSTNLPYCEVNPQNRATLKCLLPSEIDTNKLLTILDDHNPFICKQQAPVCFIEINSDGLSAATQLLEETKIVFSIT